MLSRPPTAPLQTATGDNSPLQFWAVIEAAFSPIECTQLIDVLKQLEAGDGALVAGQFDQSVRQSTLAWLPERDDLAWVDERMARLIAQANREHFNFALEGFEEQLQLAAYGPGHYYDWHIDRGKGSTAARRKLTVSVQLTKPEGYTGGTLEINADGHPFQAPRHQGTAVIFAATTLHRVVPVISGLRHSLVAWTHGPAFV
ncbi:2OG-Fe(II) oxygenase [Magnetovibrio sp. PR-2]|uniref:2OG-Fe(II) oxygenase n=1 Tax=Magnetovibrio sp. PR-2 TaxID=3120356 RepID=UPI002FCE564A